MRINDVLTYALWRCDNGKGGTKDWAIASDKTSSTVYLAWGATGRTMQGKPIRVTGDVQTEVNRRAYNQRRDGYEYVGECKMVNNRPRMLSETDAVSQAPDEEIVDSHPDSLFFVLKFQREDANDLLTYLLETGKPFGATLENGRGNSERFVVGKWALHIVRGKPRKAVKAPRLILPTDARLKPSCAGYVKPDDGVDAVLFLMLLKRNAPEWLSVSLARGENTPVSERPLDEHELLGQFGTTPDEVRDRCVEAGLLPKPIDLGQATDAPNFFF